MQTYSMKLLAILEFKYGKILQSVKPLLRDMPPAKRKHSERVAKNLKKIGVKKTGVYAALLHDYLERGGTIKKLNKHITKLGLPNEILQIVISLSQDEELDGVNNAPLHHMQSIMNNIADEDLKNMIILCKMSDRLDNLNKRAKTGKVSKNYRAKSVELIDYLVDNYTGDEKLLKNILNGFNLPI